jgi:hypothetical protein
VVGRAEARARIPEVGRAEAGAGAVYTLRLIVSREAGSKDAFPACLLHVLHFQPLDQISTAAG